MPVVVAGAIAAGASIYGANKAASSAKKAARQQAAGIEKGIGESQPYYTEGQNFLQPYVQSGQQYAGLMGNIMGLGGQEGSDAALASYRSSPSAALLADVKDETFRRGMNTWAGQGGANSGRAIEDLSRRMSDVTLNDYYRWRDLGQNMYGVGANAANSAATLAGRRGETILGARTGQGTALGSGTAAGGLYQAAAGNQIANTGANLLGRYGNTDFSNMFGSGTTANNYDMYSSGMGYS